MKYNLNSLKYIIYLLKKCKKLSVEVFITLLANFPMFDKVKVFIFLFFTETVEEMHFMEEALLFITTYYYPVR